jgi:pyruvate, water dikinase
MSKNKPLEQIIDELKERAKELNCLYFVQEILNKSDKLNSESLQNIVDIIPEGFQYPDISSAILSCPKGTHTSKNFEESPWELRSDIVVQDVTVGHICVYYSKEMPKLYEGPFLKEERKLLDSISERIGLQSFHEQLKSVFESKQVENLKAEWWVILDMLSQTDPRLLVRLARKMVNYLCWTGVSDAEKLLENFSPVFKSGEKLTSEVNKPYQRQENKDLIKLAYEIFNVASQNLREKEILEYIHKWTKEDRSGFLSEVLENSGSSLANIASSVERYNHLAPSMLILTAYRKESFTVALIRRLLTEQYDFINIAKDQIDIQDFNDLLHHVISPPGGYGKLGGKSSGLFLAKHILKNASKHNKLLTNIKTPKTWYIISDGILNFMSYNNLDEIIEQKYKEVGQVRQEYPYVIHVFKNSMHSPDVIKGLLMALEDFGNTPLIIRSSSILEDRVGAVFAGKYKSLFIANQGSKEKRLNELTDAIAEVYASTFGPDPIGYRSNNNLLDFHEEMGIMIQEVVGVKVGPYYLPSFAGVAFSRNEFRWSGRIKPEDGLVRMVPGLGTRAVDRLSDDYPVLLSPGQPNLRVNVSIDEIIRYSPKFIDVINLEDETFETIRIDSLLKRYGKEFPMFSRIISIIKQDHLQPARPLVTDFKKDSFVINFEGLFKRTDFLKEIKEMLTVLQDTYGHPVDIEFAHDGKDFYLLQCRSQSYDEFSVPAKIPLDVEFEKTIFSANKFISNGTVSGITHLVYVDPDGYSNIKEHQDLLKVGKAVGILNQLLPKKQFILMGPGRWGSRGDIKLGVSITYSEINNTSMLIEIARVKNDYVPDLSFGTHFFQDLVETNIRYLPLYPDEKGNIFNEDFLSSAPNIFSQLIPEMSHLENVIKVIDIPSVYKDSNLNIYLNSEQEKAIGVIENTEHKIEIDFKSISQKPSIDKDIHWQWRLRNVEKLAAKIDPERFGVVGFYVFGSTKNATARAESDIDILIHFRGKESQKHDLMMWLEGWSLSLAQINFIRTGHKTSGLLDVHIVTDKDISDRNSFAIKIGAVTDAARPLNIGTDIEDYTT